MINFNTIIYRYYNQYIYKRSVQSISPVLRYVYTLRLIGADFVAWCMLYIHEGDKMAFVRKFRCTIVGEPSNHIHQDTKSARLIAVCKRSFKRRTVVASN